MKINIICGIDDKFVQPCGVLMVSVFENNKNYNIVFHIIIQELRDKNIDILKHIADSYKQEVIIHKISSEIFKDSPTNSLISSAAYNRISAPDILSIEENNCIYMDSDMIVNGSFKELINIDLKDKAVGVVIDQSCDDIRHYNRLDYNQEKNYFNSGLLLINLKVWRKENITKRVLDYILNNRESIKFHDQDALNYILQDLTHLLPLKYNVQYSFFFKEPLIARCRWSEMKEAVTEPIIIHYTNKLKPWYRECTHPYKNVWSKYNSLTIWKNKFRVKSFKGYCIYMIKKILNK